jgi:hypothetical protein
MNKRDRLISLTFTKGRWQINKTTLQSYIQAYFEEVLNMKVTYFVHMLRQNLDTYTTTNNVTTSIVERPISQSLILLTYLCICVGKGMCLIHPYYQDYAFWSRDDACQFGSEITVTNKGKAFCILNTKGDKSETYAQTALMSRTVEIVMAPDATEEDNNFIINMVKGNDVWLKHCINNNYLPLITMFMERLFTSGINKFMKKPDIKLSMEAKK